MFAGLIQRFLNPLLIGGMVACVAVIAGQAWKLKTTRTELAEARQQVTQLEGALDQARLKAAVIEAELIEAKRAVEIKYATDVARLNAALANARRMLADERAARARLRPAEESPAACRAYAAPPTQLSVPDAGFLIGEADRADRIAVQLNRLIDFVERACPASDVSAH